MSRLSLLLVCLALFVCVSFASSAPPSPAVQKTRLAAKSNSNAQQSSSVVAVSKATAEAKVGILAFGVWLHDKAPVTEDRSLLKLHAKVAHPKDDKRHGLATRKAPSAHYATLRLDNTWSASEKYCGSVGGSLCTYKQVCPQGQGKPAIGSTEIPFNRRSWAPIKDGSNKWVNMEPGPYAGPEARCVTADNPDWGRTKKTLKEINQDWENHSKSLVPCCNAEGVMKSYLRPGSKYPGRHAKDEEVGPLHDLPVYYIPVSVLGGSHVGPWGNVKAPLRDQAEWIWNDPNAIRGVPAQTRPLEFQLRYVAKQEYKNAVLHFVIDDVGTVFVNGKQVATGGGGWGTANPSKATINLRKGLNVIEFHNKNGGGPAGFIAACWHGNLKLFQTDKTWTTSRRGV